MIAFLDGEVAWLDEDSIVLAVAGVGYRVHVPTYMIETAQLGEKRRIYTYQHVREDALLLFGFASDNDRKLFVRLQSASGVGPKLALQILSHVETAQLLKALRHEDVVSLKKVPGVGVKTAQRLVLELKDRLDDLWQAEAHDEGVADPLRKAVAATSDLSEELREVQEALQSLGYTERETIPVLLSLSAELSGLGLAERVRRALRAMSS